MWMLDVFLSLEKTHDEIGLTSAMEHAMWEDDNAAVGETQRVLRLEDAHLEDEFSVQRGWRNQVSIGFTVTFSYLFWEYP